MGRDEVRFFSFETTLSGCTGMKFVCKPDCMNIWYERLEIYFLWISLSFLMPLTSRRRLSTVAVVSTKIFRYVKGENF